ncbi:hypothetical protein E2C01_036980 [Portunus trituberculatus]|uniref:Uncharacterized protein n=1 Tax=Portunus trituberculatus TaxID=210409 RepID=A0A5B7FDE3_PORTR|nr:hypothetical protein [Portunus trituberculatus]
MVCGVSTSRVQSTVSKSEEDRSSMQIASHACPCLSFWPDLSLVEITKVRVTKCLRLTSGRVSKMRHKIGSKECASVTEGNHVRLESKYWQDVKPYPRSIQAGTSSPPASWTVIARRAVRTSGGSVCGKTAITIPGAMWLAYCFLI